MFQTWLKNSYLWNHWNNGFSNKEDNYGNNCFNTSFDKKQWDHDISSCIKIGKKKILLKAQSCHSNIACEALMPYFFFKFIPTDTNQQMIDFTLNERAANGEWLTDLNFLSLFDLFCNVHHERLIGSCHLPCQPWV